MATPTNLAEIEDAEEDETNSKTATDALPEVGTICRVCREVGKFEVSRMVSWSFLNFNYHNIVRFYFDCI